MFDGSTICAISTPPGNGAISIIRLSGKNSITIADKLLFSGNDKSLILQKHKTIHKGNLVFQDQVIDEVLVTLFKAPHSYTGENVVEISCHGSVYIQKRIIEVLVQSGARPAEPGEFTLRAFMNGKIDLTQAEAVADLIASQSKAAHNMAMQQMRGGFSMQIKNLRKQLLHFASLIELELDFSEEDVEFADRNEILKIINEILDLIETLTKSFELGNVLKNGVPVAIVGEPNVGKSTLLNAILNEEKAIVSEIPGTTRDAIEDTINIGGITFRFIDTAGIRHTTDTIETKGVERTFSSIEKAEIILFVADANDNPENIEKQIKKITSQYEKNIVLVINKIDKYPEYTEKLKKQLSNKNFTKNTVFISALKQTNLQNISDYLVQTINEKHYSENDLIISNARHYEALCGAMEAGKRVVEGINTKLSTDFLAQDLMEMLHYLGAITGEITTDEILGNVFKNFCIGK